MANCIFCKIVKGEIPCTKLYEDSDTFAFLDIQPINKGHILVIPKKHHKDIFTTPKKELDKITETVQKVAKALEKMSDGVNIIQNNKKPAGQYIFHLHFHVIPRYKNDGNIFNWNHVKYKKGEDKEMVKKIKNLL